MCTNTKDKGDKKMTREELIKRIEECKDCLVYDVDTNEVTDHAREKAYICLAAALEYLRDNEE